jgi:hypothetical protein
MDIKKFAKEFELVRNLNFNKSYCKSLDRINFEEKII